MAFVVIGSTWTTTVAKQTFDWLGEASSRPDAINPAREQLPKLWHDDRDAIQNGKLMKARRVCTPQNPFFHVACSLFRYDGKDKRKGITSLQPTNRTNRT